jgi:hypothetical protein
MDLLTVTYLKKIVHLLLFRSLFSHSVVDAQKRLRG